MHQIFYDHFIGLEIACSIDAGLAFHAEMNCIIDGISFAIKSTKAYCYNSKLATNLSKSIQAR
jgi:hypothetical protein